MYSNELIDNMKILAANNDGSVNFFLSNYILNNLELVQELSIDDFAKKANTSKPSIVRFCQKLNLEGFAELKFVIKNYLKNNNYWSKLALQCSLANKNLSDEWYQRYVMIQEQASTLLHAAYQEKIELIHRLLTKIQKSNRIYIFAMNLEYSIAQSFVQTMVQMGYDTFAEKDILIIETYIKNVKPDDLIIIISLSGYNPYLEPLIKNHQCYLFGLFGQNGSLSKLCDDYFTLPQSDSDELFNLFSLKSQTLLGFFDYLYMDLKPQIYK